MGILKNGDGQKRNSVKTAHSYTHSSVLPVGIEKSLLILVTKLCVFLSVSIAESIQQWENELESTEACVSLLLIKILPL